MSPPVPLRMLYKRSERVVVARAAGSEREKSREDEAYRRTTFDISESIKGGHGESKLQVVHYTYPDSPEYEGNFNKGDRRLLFLNHDDELGAYHVSDMRYGAKKLSDEDLKVYLERIEELSALLLKEKVDDAEIVEWLVRCAEEPATRWEGAYELYAGASMARNEADVEKQKSEAGGEGGEEGEAEGGESEAEEPAEQSTEAEAAADAGAVFEPVQVVTALTLPVGPETGEAVGLPFLNPGRVYGTDIKPEAVAKLTQDQKTRLANALYSADKIGEGETTLLDVVKEWGDDGRLVPFLTNHLRGLEKDPPDFAAELMSALADALKDKALAKLVENYVENAPYEDDDEGEESEESEEEDDEGEASEDEKASAAGDKKKVSAAEKRSEMLREFLAAVDNRIQYDLAMQLSR